MIRSLALTIAMIVAAPTLALADYNSAMQSYESGNYQTAFTDFELSANAGDSASQYMLGEMYAQGDGATQNYVKAHMWYNLAASQGHTRANQARSRLETRMTAAQIAEAQTLAEKWQPATAASGTVTFSVRNMQMLLNDLGYDAGVEDGIMGSRTRSAIRAYQQNHGLVADGQLTAGLFNRIALEVGGTSTTPTPSPDPAGLVANIQSELRERGYDIPSVTGTLDWKTRQAIEAYQSNSGIAVDGKATASLLSRLRSSQGLDQLTRASLVRAVQSELNGLGYNAGPADGVFGPTTRAAVRTFQNDNGLPVTGEVTQSLLTNIRQAPGDDGTVDVQRVALVKAVEQALDVRGYEVGPIDGKVTTQTTSAVRTYQSDAGLTVNGRIDESLLARLERGQANLDPTMTRTQLVQSIQTALNQQGYNAGAADGVFDSVARSAILAYQGDFDLPLTGEPSPQLLTHLASSSLEPGAAGVYDGGYVSQVTAIQLNKDIQVELNRLGYNVGVPDGLFGTRTRQAVLSYQKEVGVPQTGEPSRQLLTQLQRSYRSGSLSDPSAVMLGLANQFIGGMFDNRK
jgi:peptidoglycan hydrolase-like protein with peptidoglycan-binding domain